MFWKKSSSRKQRQDFQSQRHCDFKSGNRSQETKLQGYPDARTASERLKDLKVKRSKWKRKTASKPMRERERPNGVTTALWQRCRRVTWRIKWLSDPCQNWALTPSRPGAPTTLPCHSCRISAIHMLIHKDNKAVWPTRTAFWNASLI